MEIIYKTEADWLREEEVHHRILNDTIGEYLNERKNGKKNPVLDFLFEYYSFRPAQLMRWSPGLGVVLKGQRAKKFLEQAQFIETSEGITLSEEIFNKKPLPGLEWIENMLKATSSRPPYYLCHGLHEWAMVYKTNNPRHGAVSFRLSQKEIENIVDELKPSCTHYDAFKFFTEAAKPLNAFKLERDQIKDFEQPGCLHANMDLYKYAYKLYPWIASSLIRDCFLQSLKIRQIDMEASPYDLKEYGVKAIAMESREGREIYISKQKEIFTESAGLRKRLVLAYLGLNNLVKAVLS